MQQRTTILVIDDDPATARQMSDILAHRGYRIMNADDVSQGLLLIGQHRPELVLMDYQLSANQIFQILKECRQNFPDSYIIMATAQGSAELAVELMKAGASEYLLKPFELDRLSEKIDSVRKIREIELANRALQAEREHLLLEIETWNRELQTRVQDKTEALHRAQSEIAQTEKLAALGYLAAGMAHEIRNPLNSISLFTQLLKQGADESESGEYLGKILKEIDRIDAIIRKLVNAANQSRMVVNDVRIEQVIKNALDIFTPQIEARQIDVHLLCDRELPLLKADPTELEQIFTNLLMNAVEELSLGGCITISLSCKDDHIAVRFADTGSGIDEEYLDAIFKPFFSTKSRGTGIGLPVAQRIARLYHGDVAVELTSASGTTFLVTIPVEQEKKNR